MLRIPESKRTFHRARIALGFATAFALGCACNDRSPLISPSLAMVPGVPVSAALSLEPGSLPEGATASFPEFDSDAFSAVLPVHAQETLSPQQALEQITPVVRAMGFQRSLAELQVPQEPIPLPSPDLSALASEVCHEAALQLDRGSIAVCSVLRGNDALSSAAETAIEDAYGTSFAEFRSSLERPVFQYAFPQLVGGVPIDGAGAYAFRREGESLSLVHGTLFNRYEVVNQPARDGVAILEAARSLLGERWGEGPLELLEETELVMVPYGSKRVDGGEVPALRHAWRALLRSPRTRESWMVWIDAETASLLDVRPQQDGAVGAKGERWRRDPGLCQPGDPPCTEVVTFEVDEPEDSELVLALDGVFDRLESRSDENGDNVDDEDVAVSDPDADFTKSIGDEERAVCATGKNTAFRQVHAYSHLYSFRKLVVSAGSFPAFPVKPINVWIDDPDPDLKGNWAGYDAWPPGGALMRFGEGKGFRDLQCPDAPGLRLNGVQDAATLTHEMSHLSVKRLQERRPKDWCKPPAGAKATCPKPEGRGLFHDFADALANAYTSTNCFSGWGDKNTDIANANLYCQNPAKTSEKGGFPRLAHVPDAWDPKNPGDHFPEHHSGDNVTDYADGQIAAAALWRVRQGMRSKSPAAGTVEYWVRLNRALWSFGFVKPVCSKMADRENTVGKSCELDLHRYLQDLERRMVEQWAAASTMGAAGRHTANKVLSGFARAGIFLTLHQCLDKDFKSSKTVESCFAAGQPAGDAVIDVDDRDSGDDPVVDGVKHVEVDYLERSGPAPLFRIWTGPRYRFGKDSAVSTQPPYPCHPKFQVEVASDNGFTQNVWKSAVLSAPECYGEVELPASAWNPLKGTSGSPKIYYRARTWDASNAKERISTSPGAGAFNVPPPFVVVNDSGKP